MRTMIVDSQPIFREGLIRILEETRGFQVVAELSDGCSALKLAGRTPSELAIINTSLPGLDGITLIRELQRTGAGARVLVLTTDARHQTVTEAFQAGAFAYVLKNESRAVLVDALRAIKIGSKYLGPAVATSKTYQPDPDATPNGAHILRRLTSRERAIFRLAIKGLSSRQMAAELAISSKTIATHRMHINRKLKCRSPSELIRFAAFNGLLEGAG
jgi:DNA-binding NarL/FixJ family response regulator